MLAFLQNRSAGAARESQFLVMRSQSAARCISVCTPRQTRQHVNTLSRCFQEPPELDWPQLLACSADLPIHLDLGCATGDVIASLSARRRDWAFVGLEVRAAVAEAARARLAQAGTLADTATVLSGTNVQFTAGSVLGSLAAHTGRPRPLDFVSLQHPDPWFKRRHSTRRVLTPFLAVHLAARMPAGTALLLQTDVADAMRAMLHAAAHPLVMGGLGLAALETRRYRGDEAGEVITPPGLPSLRHEAVVSLDDWLGVPSRREAAVRQEGGYVSRALLVATGVAPHVPDLPLERDTAGPVGLPRAAAQRAANDVTRWGWGGTVPAVRLAPADSIEPLNPALWRLPARYDAAGGIRPRPQCR